MQCSFLSESTWHEHLAVVLFFIWVSYNLWKKTILVLYPLLGHDFVCCAILNVLRNWDDFVFLINLRFTWKLWLPKRLAWLNVYLHCFDHYRFRCVLLFNAKSGFEIQNPRALIAAWVDVRIAGPLLRFLPLDSHLLLQQSLLPCKVWLIAYSYWGQSSLAKTTSSAHPVLWECSENVAPSVNMGPKRVTIHEARGFLWREFQLTVPCW